MVFYVCFCCLIGNCYLKSHNFGMDLAKELIEHHGTKGVHELSAAPVYFEPSKKKIAKLALHVVNLRMFAANI